MHVRFARALRYMELIGKGSYERGILWVALRVPDGHVHAHANQARITTFLPCDDESTCMMAPDVVSFAIARGYWRGAADDPTFSFSDTYDPLTFSGARFCEARVWHVFRAIADRRDFDAEAYFDCAPPPPRAASRRAADRHAAGRRAADRHAAGRRAAGRRTARRRTACRVPADLVRFACPTRVCPHRVPVVVQTRAAPT